MYKILLVEDDRNTLEGLANILEQEGYEVVKAILSYGMINFEVDHFSLYNLSISLTFYNV